MEKFHIIKIKNKNCYLAIDDKNGRPKWTTKKNDCIHFDMRDEAESFAKNYFKKFENYEIVENSIAFAK